MENEMTIEELMVFIREAEHDFIICAKPPKEVDGDDE